MLALNTYRDVTLGCVQPSGSCLENGEINEIRHKERSAECWRRERQTMETLLELSPYPVPLPSLFRRPCSLEEVVDELCLATRLVNLFCLSLGSPVFGRVHVSQPYLMV